MQARTEVDAKCRAEAKAAHFAVPAGPRECMRVDVNGNMEFLTVRALRACMSYGHPRSYGRLIS